LFESGEASSHQEAMRVARSVMKAFAQVSDLAIKPRIR
jgi:hypothetical protein